MIGHIISGAHSLRSTGWKAGEPGRNTERLVEPATEHIAVWDTTGKHLDSFLSNLLPHAIRL